MAKLIPLEKYKQRNGATTARAVNDEAPEVIGKEEATPYPIGAISNFLQASLKAIERTTQAPQSLVANSLLAGVSLATQGLADVRLPHGDVAPISLFTLTIAESGERKSAVDGYIRTPMQAWVGQYCKDHEHILKLAKAEHKAWKAEIAGVEWQIRSHKGKGDAAYADLQALKERLKQLELAEPSIPVMPDLFYGDATQEAILSRIAQGWPIASIWTDEGGAITGSYAFKAENVTRYFSSNNKFWDGGVQTVHRKGAETIVLEGKRVSCNIMLQPALFGQLQGGGNLAQAIGFLARFLMVYPKSNKGTRIYRQPTEEDLATIKSFNQRQRELLDMLAQSKDQPRPVLELSPGATQAAIDYYNQIERESGKFGRYGDVSDIASKSLENAARLAAIFHVWEFGPEGEITTAEMQQACELARWYLEEAKRILSNAEASPQENNALLLLEWVKKKETEVFNNRDLQIYGPSRFRKNKPTREAALKTLIDAGYLQKIGEGRSVSYRLIQEGGKPDDRA